MTLQVKKILKFGSDLLRGIALLHAMMACVLVSHQAQGTHAAGAELTYRCLGGLTYEVEATFYRDCGGTPEPGNISITYQSVSCNYSRTALAVKVAGINGTEITMPCATSASTCNGGVSTGIRKWVYNTVITLPFACTDWVFSYRICCRNCTVTTIQSPCATGSELYVEAGLNNVDGPGNNSPAYTISPVVFVCLGQNFNYNMGAVDIDGDSLTYELISPKTSATAEVAWIAPASAQAPLSSSTPFIINTVTGDINFTPSALQISVMAIRINEFRNGVWIGSTIRDMQVYTQNCMNSIPYASGINNTSSFIADVCAGDTICFDIQTFDTDALQNVFVTWNNPIIGSTITQTPGSRPSLQFCWIPTSADVSNIPHIFTILVRDDACPQNGTQTFSYSVLVSGFQLATHSTDPTCSGLNNGTAGIQGGPLPGFTYVWNTSPPQYSGNITNLEPGSYTVTASNSSGCTAVSTVVLNAANNSLQVTTNATGIITCSSGNIGTIEAVAIHGTPPYTYQWSNGSLASQISGLGHGIYTLTVTDANGCSEQSIDSIPISIGIISATLASATMVSCYNGTDGSIQLAVTGGVEPYSYLWNNGETSSALAHLSAGIYSVTVSDAGGCSSNFNVVITSPASSISATVSDNKPVSCLGGNDGMIVMNISGGTPPYIYNWSNGNTSLHNNNLIQGTYHLTVTDSRGCTLNVTETITEPSSSVNVTMLNSTHVDCAGDSSGTISLDINGGVGPYLILWNTGSASDSISGLPAGIYSATVTDANGCMDTLSILIEDPEVPVSVVVTNVNHNVCGQLASGGINTTGFGGTPPLSYQWNTGLNSQNISGATSGIYTITVTDNHGCTTQSTAQIQTIGSPVLISTSGLQHVLCYNMANGYINLEVSGGAEPYTYLWSTGAVTRDVQNLISGTYTITVTDNNGCETRETYTINQPSSPLIPHITINSNVTCYGGSQGSLSLQVNGGTPPYSFLWSTGSTLQNLTGQEAGTYTVTVTDANGCNAIINQQISQPTTAVTGSVVILSLVKCHGGSDASLMINAIGGTPPLNYTWSNGSSGTILTDVPHGTYTITVTDAWGCTYVESVYVSQPQQQISVNETISSADCRNGIHGTIELELTGGTAPFTFYWSNGTTAKDLTTSVPGDYTVQITDANGCLSEHTYTMTSTSVVHVSSDGPLTICVGETITLQVDSFPDMNYQWYYEGNLLNGATGLNFTTPAEGMYYVMLSGHCGQFVSDSVEVIVKSIGNVTVSSMQIVCPPETASLLATGGITYSWSPASYITFTNVPDPIVSPMQTTVYTVEITNEYGCKSVLSTNVAVVCDSLLVPTGFSPNDDGVNDGYVIDGIENYPGNKLWVYNRWGKLVYKATDYSNLWDGVSNVSGIYMSKKLPTGTYYYILDLNDRSKPRAGYIILRR